MADNHFQDRANGLGQTCMRRQSNRNLNAKDRRKVFERWLQPDGCSLAWWEFWMISDQRTLAVSQPS